MYRDPACRDRGLAAGEFKGVNAPWRMSGAHSVIKREIPSIGSHRDDVLERVLGLSADEIAKAAASGAFGKVAIAAVE